MSDYAYYELLGEVERILVDIEDVDAEIMFDDFVSPSRFKCISTSRLKRSAMILTSQLLALDLILSQNLPSASVKPLAKRCFSKGI